MNVTQRQQVLGIQIELLPLDQSQIVQIKIPNLKFELLNFDPTVRNVRTA